MCSHRSAVDGGRDLDCPRSVSSAEGVAVGFRFDVLRVDVSHSDAGVQMMVAISPIARTAPVTAAPRNIPTPTNLIPRVHEERRFVDRVTHRRTVATAMPKRNSGTALGGSQPQDSALRNSRKVVGTKRLRPLR
jgi:hypothetical protein